MKVSSVHLKNFKRFSNLTLQSIPPNSKLILLIGSNGSGKSSVFDAFEALNHISKNEGYDPNYYKKNKANGFKIDLSLDSGLKMIIEDGQVNSGRKTDGIIGFPNVFYGRTSFRQVPRLTRTILGQGGRIDFGRDSDRPRQFIERDDRFENDIEKISEQVLREIFRDKVSAQQIQRSYIEPINSAFENIFGTGNEIRLSLIDIIPPIDGNIAQINFKKGESEIHYNYLSAGEKEVVNILFNLLVRNKQYTDSIYYLDEIDLHLNTKLQYRLIKEITENWIPKNSQLWTATHSLGFIEYANDFEQGVIFDLDDLDFDKTQILVPADKKNYQIFELAVSKEFIDKVFQGRSIVFTENTDTPLYNDLSIRDTFFFTAIDKVDVFHKSKNLSTYGLVDRDYLTDDEVVSIKNTYNKLSILPYYSLENLLYHPDNLLEYYKSHGKEFSIDEYKKMVTAEKNQERDYIVGGISKARDGYPFFKESENAKQLKQFKENWRAIIEQLRSDEFETFYKVFPAKDYGKTIEARQNLSKKDLIKTDWFRAQIESALKS
jgi:energy-coupling factor transporter ATP-binding protein EcfA2